MTKNFDIVFIGSGPAGFTGAIRAAKLGAKVAIIEMGFLGGVCLNRGCIPTKSMLRTTQTFKELKEASHLGITFENPSLSYDKVLESRLKNVEKIRSGLERTIKNNNIEVICGTADLKENGELFVKTQNGIEQITYKNLIVATGSLPRKLPDIPDYIALNSDTILALDELPERTLIIGSGAIGLEWTRILTALGKKVYVVELADKLAPVMDESVSQVVERIFKKQKIEYFTNTSVKSVVENQVILSNEKIIEVDKILVSIGRVANLTGLENAKFETVKGFIKTDRNFKTSIDNVYAIGDIIGLQLLAHTASTQAVQLVEHLLLNKDININYRNIPAIIYGKPEIATVGCTEQALRDENIEYKVSKLPLTISAKAYIDEEFDGMVKVLEVDNKIVGASIVANEASALLQILTPAIQLGISTDELSKVVYPHPTTSEAIAEAILKLSDKAIFA